MYQIYFDNYPLYDPRDDSLIIREPDIHLAVGEAGEMSFTIDSDHPYADRLTRLKGVVSLRAAGRPIFKGRIRKDSQNFRLSREIEVEGLLACLNDSAIPPFNFPEDFQDDADYLAAAESGNVVKFLLGWFLDQHNSQVGAAQKILLGDVTVSDPNNYISRASESYLTAMEAVRKKLEDTLGGYLLADYSGETTVLHYYSELPLVNTQEVEFGENLLDLVSELDSVETCTAILPVGKDGLTITGLTDGEISPGILKEGAVVYSAEAEAAVGGRVTRIVEWKDVTVESNLQTKAAALLTQEGIKTNHTIQVRAVDLGGSQGEEGIARFVVGRMVHLKSTPHGFSTTFPLMELEPDIFDPGDTQITLGASVKTSSDLAHKSQSALEEQLQQQVIELNQQKENTEVMVQSVREQVTASIQNSEAIIFEALDRYVETSNFDEFRQTVESQFQIMADEISMNFTTTTEQISNVDGDLQAKFNEVYKYIKFSGENAVTIGGSSGITLTIDNDNGIIFSKNGVMFGYWDGDNFHTGNIVVKVKERAQFGNFAFIPRSNGSLSLLKVGEPPSELKIISHPQNVRTTVGTTFTLSVVATGMGLSYLWQVQNPNIAGWTDLPQKTTAEASFTRTMAGTSYYRCVVTDISGKSLISNAATIIVA